MATILNLNKPSTFREYFVGVNEFNTQKIYTDEHAVYVLLIRLILLEPGTYPDHPEMGVGLVSKYRFALKDKVEELKSSITEQITTYLPLLSSVNVEASYNDNVKEINIDISSNKITYQMTYNPELNSLSAVI